MGACFFLLAACRLAPLHSQDQEDAKQFYQQGNGLFDQRHFAEAAAVYSRAVEKDPKLAEAYYNLALSTEMVDRQKAVEDWKKFLEVAGDAPDLKWDVARIKARLQVLESRPALPDSLQPRNYVAAAGDYYSTIAGGSEGEQWTHFPVKVFLGSAPELKWQQGAREAYDTWSALLPMELVAIPNQADIRFGWEESAEGHAGEEADWAETRRAGNQLTGRKYVLIRVDLSYRWSKDEMREICLHELGHALGLKGHSDSKKDIMYWQMQEKIRQVAVPRIPLPLMFRFLPSRPSQRDTNTLIRLYSSAGLISRFQ